MSSRVRGRTPDGREALVPLVSTPNSGPLAAPLEVGDRADAAHERRLHRLIQREFRKLAADYRLTQRFIV